MDLASQFPEASKFGTIIPPSIEPQNSPATENAALEYAKYSPAQKASVHMHRERDRLSEENGYLREQVYERQKAIDGLNAQLLSMSADIAKGRDVIGEYRAHRQNAAIFGFATTVGGLFVSICESGSNGYVFGVCLTFFSGITGALGAISATFTERALKKCGLQPR